MELLVELIYQADLLESVSPDEAERLYLSILDLEESALARYRFGKFMLKRRRAMEAVMHLEIANSLVPLHWDTLHQLAKAYAMLHEWDKAEVTADIVLEHVPLHPAAQTLKFLLLCVKGDLGTAQALFVEERVQRSNKNIELFKLITDARSNEDQDEVCRRAVQRLTGD